MSVIDIHCHIWRYGRDISEAYAAWRANLLSEQGERCWREPSRTWRKEDFHITYEDCIENMDKNGVDKTVIDGFHYRIPSSPEDKWIIVKNDYLAEAQNKYPDRLIGFASVDPLGGEQSVQEIDRAVNELGLKGIGEFVPSYVGLALDDPILDPIYKKCEDMSRQHGTPMSIHTGFCWYPWSPLEKQDPALLWHVLEKFPELKIKVDHAGQGGTWDHALHLALAWPNVYLDFTILSMTYSPFQIMGFLQHAKAVGILNRCCWGSDYPDVDRKDDRDMYRRFPAESKKLGIEPVLTEADMEAFLGLNAEIFLGLK